MLKVIQMHATMGGCEYVDKVEKYAIDGAKKLFGCQYANVQPHSGVNNAAYTML